MFLKFILIFILVICLMFAINHTYTFIMIKKCHRDDYGFLYKTVNDVKLAYMKKGIGPPLLVIHGFMASSICFEDILEDLSKKNMVYLVDVIGFGFSDKNPKLDYTRGSIAKTLLEFMEAEGIHSFNLLGHSMGGEIALNMVLDSPKRVKKLMLVSSAGTQKIKVIPKFIASKPILCNLFINNFFMTYLFQKHFFEKCLCDKKCYKSSMFNDIFTISKKNIPAETLRQITLQADGLDILPKLRFIENETLIIWGEEDSLIKLEFGHRIHESIKNSQIKIIKDCNHNPFIEKPEEFLNIVNEFLDS